MVQKSCATWGVLNPVNSSINQQTKKHQLVLDWALYDPRNNILRNFALHWEVLTGLQATWDDSTTRWRQRSSEITLSKSVKHSHLLWVHGSVICDFLEMDEKPLDYETQPLTPPMENRFVKVKGVWSFRVFKVKIHKLQIKLMIILYDNLCVILYSISISNIHTQSDYVTNQQFFTMSTVLCQLGGLETLGVHVPSNGEIMDIWWRILLVTI